jgi:uncharacterized oligopeptide transporter (OPT) family protein
MPESPRWRWLPPAGSWRHHALLAFVGIFLLGPLGGIAAAYMLFSVGFMVAGQVLAGILGSAVTLGYGAQGRHGANCIQTTAASVSGMCAAATLVQAMAWLGMPQPPAWQLALYLMCIGMFGVGVGMLYTPLLVDRMQLTFPSGLAVANLLRALTDPALLRRSVARLAGGGAMGLAAGVGGSRLAWLGGIELSASTLGAGMVVGARLGVAALTGGLVAWLLTPWFVSIAWLQAGEPYRKITFLIALGMILGAALVDVGSVLAQAWRRASRTAPARGSERKLRLFAWVAFWGMTIVLVGSRLLHQPVAYLLVAIALVFVFALVNGIAAGMVDLNPISSAFVVSVMVMGALGLTDPASGLVAASVLLVATGEAGDMQQDRSTGWRLGTDRTVQFRYQVGGIVVGAILAVVLAELFLRSYPVLRLDQTRLAADQQPAQWASAMTYKIVGALRSLTDDQPHQRRAIAGGVAIGLATELLRRAIRSSAAYQRWIAQRRAGAAFDFALDAVLLPSPYASSFGGFVNLPTVAWFAAGGVVSALLQRRGREGDLPRDMSTASLVGGGLIAGDALAALGLGIAGLLL